MPRREVQVELISGVHTACVELSHPFAVKEKYTPAEFEKHEKVPHCALSMSSKLLSSKASGLDA